MEVKLDDSALRAALARLRAAAGDARPAFREIGEYLIEATRRRFVEGRGPDGTAWAPNSPATLARVLPGKGAAAGRRGRPGGAGKRPLLGESLQLSRQWSYRADDRSVTVGTPLAYAATQQFGARKGQFGRTRRGAPIPWGTIPARPFLGLSAADREAVLALVSAHLRRAGET